MAATTEQLVTQVEKELKSDAAMVVVRAEAIKVHDQATYTQACEMLTLEIKPLAKRWLDYWTPLKDSAYKTYKGILGKLQEGTDPIERAERHLKGQIASFEQEQARIREEAQRKAQAAAEEAARIEQEKMAEYAEMAGATEQEVQAIAEAPVVVVAAPVQTFERVSGVSTRSKWVAVVTDIKKLAGAVAKGLAPTNYILPNQSALDKRATADQTTLNLPGVTAREEKIVVGRTR